MGIQQPRRWASVGIVDKVMDSWSTGVVEFWNEKMIRLYRIWCFVLLAMVFTAGVSYNQTKFDERKDRLLAVASQQPYKDFLIITAKLRTGVGVPHALSMLDSLTADESIGGMFYAYGLIGT